MVDRPRAVGEPPCGVWFVAVHRPGERGMALRCLVDVATGQLWMVLGDEALAATSVAELNAATTAGLDACVAHLDPRDGYLHASPISAPSTPASPDPVRVHVHSGEPGAALQALEVGAADLAGGAIAVLSFGTSAMSDLQAAPLEADLLGPEEVLVPALARAVEAGGAIAAVRCGVGAAGAATHQVELALRCELEAIEVVNATFDRFAADHAVPANVRRTFDIAFDDLINNAVSYGFPGLDEEARAERVLEVRVSFDGRHVEAEISDDGVAYDPFSNAEPDTELDLEDREIGGLGVHLVKTMMDHVSYARRGDRNVVVIRKALG